MHDLRVTFPFPKLLSDIYVIWLWLSVSCHVACALENAAFSQLYPKPTPLKHRSVIRMVRDGKAAATAPLSPTGRTHSKRMEEFLVHQLFTQIPASKSVTFKNSPTPMWPICHMSLFRGSIMGGHLLRARFSCCCCKQDLWNFPVYFRNEESHTDSQELSTTEVLGNGLWLVSCSMCWCC